MLPEQNPHNEAQKARITVSVDLKTNNFVIEEDVEVFGFAIKKGYQFNGHSVPKALTPFTGGRYCPRYILAALVHDYTYHTGVDRKEADNCYLKNLRRCEVSTNLSYVMYSAVRLFGWIKYLRVSHVY